MEIQFHGNFDLVQYEMGLLTKNQRNHEEHALLGRVKRIRRMKKLHSFYIPMTTSCVWTGRYMIYADPV